MPRSLAEIIAARASNKARNAELKAKSCEIRKPAVLDSFQLRDQYGRPSSRIDEPAFAAAHHQLHGTEEIDLDREAMGISWRAKPKHIEKSVLDKMKSVDLGPGAGPDRVIQRTRADTGAVLQKAERQGPQPKDDGRRYLDDESLGLVWNRTLGAWCR